MIFRVGCDAAQHIQVQIVVQMPIDVIQHPLHPGMVVLKPRLHRSVLRGSTSQAHAGMTRSTDLAVLSRVGEHPGLRAIVLTDKTCDVSDPASSTPCRGA